MEGQGSPCLNTLANYCRSPEAQSRYFINLTMKTFGLYGVSLVCFQITSTSYIKMQPSQCLLTVSLVDILSLTVLGMMGMRPKLVCIIQNVLSAVSHKICNLSVFSTGHPGRSTISPAPSEGGRGAKSSGCDPTRLQNRVGQRNASPVWHLHQ